MSHQFVPSFPLRASEVARNEHGTLLKRFAGSGALLTHTTRSPQGSAACSQIESHASGEQAICQAAAAVAFEAVGCWRK